MTTQTEALRMALEALEGWGKGFPDNWGDLDTEAVTAIKEALALSESSTKCEETSHAQPEQAWRNAAIRVGEYLCSVGPFGYYDMTAKQWLDWALSVVTVHAPTPQRKPLTDEEIKAVIASIDPEEQYMPKALQQFARAIEAAHGIKE